jgi:cation:H+ antiporter
MANDKLIDGAPSSILSRADGWVLLGFFSIFMYYAFGIAREGYKKDASVREMSGLWSAIYLIGGLIGLALGAEWIVDGGVKIAKVVGVSESLIALTIISIGTSLPELATSAVAAYKKKADIAVGNVVGSNIFNILWVLGISAAIKPLPFQPKSNVDIGMTLLATLLLFIFLFIGRNNYLHRWQGISFVSLYGAYLTLLVFLEIYTDAIL